MKTIRNLLVVIACVLAATDQARSQGYLVPNGVITNYYDALPGEISVVHDPTNYYYTGFLLDPYGKTPPTVYTNTFRFGAIVDVSVRVFLVASNQPVSLTPILSSSYTELEFFRTYIFNSGQPFYVGLYTGNDRWAPLNGIYEDPLFGWARLVNNRGVIQLLDSALAYKAGGILVGTQTLLPVPEPGRLGLFGLGLATLYWRLRQRR